MSLVRAAIRAGHLKAILGSITVQGEEVIKCSARQAAEKPTASVHQSRVLWALQPQEEPLGMQWMCRMLGNPSSPAHLLCCRALLRSSPATCRKRYRVQIKGVASPSLG